MAKLTMTLAPFSPDYSGAGAVLFDLHTVTVMHDGGGCNGNYAMHDEPRWIGSRAGIFSSALREMDVILGDDEKLLEKMEQAREELNPELMAVISSPVPALTGIDVVGIAMELEARTGVPCIGIETTGLELYDRGAFRAAKALAERFLEPGKPEKGRVNILGATPMDFGLGQDVRRMKAYLESLGYQVGLTFAMDYSLEEFRALTRGQVNLAVSSFGYRFASWLEKEFGMPWLCGFPAGEQGAAAYAADLERVCRTGESRIRGLEDGEEESSGHVLYVGEQVTGNSIRAALRAEGYPIPLRVGCPFGWVPELAHPEDLSLPDERSIRAAIRDEAVTCVMGDPFLQPFLGEKPFIPLPHFAFSGKLKLREHRGICGAEFGKILEELRNLE